MSDTPLKTQIQIDPAIQAVEVSPGVAAAGTMGCVMERPVLTPPDAWEPA